MGHRSSLKTTLEYAAARVVLGVLGILPRPPSIAAGRGMGLVAYWLAGKLRRTGERNLKLAFPDKSEAERKRILRNCFRSLGRQLGEFSQIRRLSSEELCRRVRCEGLEHLAGALAEGRGVLMATGHLGAWELTALMLSAHGYPLSFLARRIDNPRVERLVEGTRSRFGNRSIDKRTASRAMLRVVNEGGILGALVDVNMLEHEGIFVDFFGVPASTTFTLAKLALRTNAPVVPIFAPFEEEEQSFVVRVLPPLKFERTGDAQADTAQLTAKITSAIEGNIRRYPDQWLWIHKRWKTRPPGEPEIYD